MSWDRKRPSAAEGRRQAVYSSPEHRRLRKEWVARIAAAGGWPCWRCQRLLLPGTRWHLGHDDDDRTVYRGPECVSCNLRAAASKGAQVTNARRRGRLPPTPPTSCPCSSFCQAVDAGLPRPPGCYGITARRL